MRPTRIAFDLDDVLCERSVEGPTKEKYNSCVPIQKMIDVCNKAYDEGCEITIFTARGMDVFKKNKDLIIDELFELTKNQLRDWGVKHHNLVMGKQPYDLLIDDKAGSSFDIKSFDDVIKAKKRSQKKL